LAVTHPTRAPAAEGGVVLSAFKFTQRDPHALHYLVGTIAAGAICGIVSGIL